MNDIKRSFANLAYYNPQSIQHTLETMAAQGWMIESLGTYLWTYRRIPPQKLRFAVTYFPKASDFDPGPTEGELTKEDFCALDGWHLAARRDVIQIFYTEREDAVPIETDPVIQVDNIYRAMKKQMFFPQLLLTATILFQLYIQITQLRLDPIEYLSHPLSLYLVPFWCLLLLQSVVQLWMCLHWHRRAKKAAETDHVFLPFRFNPIYNLFLATLLLLFLALTLTHTHFPVFLVLIWVGGIPLMVFGSNGLKRSLKRQGASRLTNKLLVSGSLVLWTILLIGVLTITLLHSPRSAEEQPVGSYEYQGQTFDIYDDPLPLEVADLMEVEGRWSKEVRRQETLLLRHGEYVQNPLLTESQELPDLSYTITDVKYPFLYPLCKTHTLTLDEDDLELFQLSYQPLDAASFGVDELYQRCYHGEPSNYYLVFFQNRIITLSLDEHCGLEQVRKAIHILIQARV